MQRDPGLFGFLRAKLTETLPVALSLEKPPPHFQSHRCDFDDDGASSDRCTQCEHYQEAELGVVRRAWRVVVVGFWG